MGEDPHATYDRWARLRFAVVGPLLAAPPDPGDLHAEIEKLAAKPWTHPTSGDLVQFAYSTIERWYYAAKNERRDPVGILRRRVRKDSGTYPSLNEKLRAAIRGQWKDHKSWTVQLHVDNLAVRAEEDPDLGRLASYATVRRWMKNEGLTRQRRVRRPDTLGAALAEQRLDNREVRSFEAEYVHGLWHLDFHSGSLKVLTPVGDWETPHLLGVLDDRSRLGCHAQWYLEETTQALTHGLSQGIQKRALPRALMNDRGSAMLAAETVQGLEALGILHQPTLPYSPYQNAKQEVFWAQVESRLMAMLEGVKDLTLELLNEATQAWIEIEYNRKFHDEIGCSPLERYLAGPSVGRESPSAEDLRRAFRMRAIRTQRRSDGTVSIEGRRFEVPSRFRHMQRIPVRYARWDLRLVDMVDPKTGTLLGRLTPLDKTRNADGLRRTLAPISHEPTPPPASGMAPLLRKLMAQYASTGLPPAYLPLPDPSEENDP